MKKRLVLAAAGAVVWVWEKTHPKTAAKNRIIDEHGHHIWLRDGETDGTSAGPQPDDRR